jgi:hypothetical protein
MGRTGAKDWAPFVGPANIPVAAGRLSVGIAWDNAALWQWKSRRRGGRPRIGKVVRDLIRRMSIENQLWGAPRIHGELLKLGINVAQSTVSVYMLPRQGRPLQSWKRHCHIRQV